MANATTPTKPVETFRRRGISASVFLNTVKKDDRTLTFHKVQLQKTFKDGKEFRSTNSFGREDLPIAALLLQRAWEFVLEAEAKKPQGDLED